MLGILLRGVLPIGALGIVAAQFLQPTVAPVASPDQAMKRVEKVAEARIDEDFVDVETASEARARRVRALMDQAVDILSTNEAEHERIELQRIADAIADERARIAELRIERGHVPAAPAADDVVGNLMVRLGVNRTREVIDHEIATAEARIAQLEADGAAVRAGFAAALADMGIDLDPQQIEGLLTLATAEGILEVLVVVDNLKSITQRLSEATRAAGEELEVARRYYGIYVTMVEVATYAHEDFVAEIDERFMVQLAEIEDRAQRLLRETDAMIARERDVDLRRVLASNRDAQQLTLRAVSIYREHLGRQRSEVAGNLAVLRRKQQVALNTYRTVELNVQLVAMLREGNKTFEALLQLELPPLEEFTGTMLRQEIDRISDELRGAPAV